MKELLEELNIIFEEIQRSFLLEDEGAAGWLYFLDSAKFIEICTFAGQYHERYSYRFEADILDDIQLSGKLGIASLLRYFDITLGKINSSLKEDTRLSIKIDKCKGYSITARAFKTSLWWRDGIKN